MNEIDSLKAKIARLTGERDDARKQCKKLDEIRNILDRTDTVRVRRKPELSDYS